MRPKPLMPTRTGSLLPSTAMLGGVAICIKNESRGKTQRANWQRFRTAFWRQRRRRSNPAAVLPPCASQQHMQ
jgi:hypothetical protein